MEIRPRSYSSAAVVIRSTLQSKNDWPLNLYLGLLENRHPCAGKRRSSFADDRRLPSRRWRGVRDRADSDRLARAFGAGNQTMDATADGMGRSGPDGPVAHHAPQRNAGAAAR